MDPEFEPEPITVLPDTCPFLVVQYALEGSCHPKSTSKHFQQRRTEHWALAVLELSQPPVLEAFLPKLATGASRATVHLYQLVDNVDDDDDDDDHDDLKRPRNNTSTSNGDGDSDSSVNGGLRPGLGLNLEGQGQGQGRGGNVNSNGVNSSTSTSTIPKSESRFSYINLPYIEFIRDPSLCGGCLIGFIPAPCYSNVTWLKTNLKFSIPTTTKTMTRTATAAVTTTTTTVFPEKACSQNAEHAQQKLQTRTTTTTVEESGRDCQDWVLECIKWLKEEKPGWIVENGVEEESIREELRREKQRWEDVADVVYERLINSCLQ
ncbi:hypothetical protein K435DRAFT_974259 [Dendrothele bispora CBS 962.96]|uniref:Uncharacterized protein n=1 Tax=Dendrothele bispora (strain CBS 962.96) TaxID=1314807 RepID=A0A4S8KMP6_DENBC|nr:hypothetical protein K435DRAFT_974259 [Dendrothele bispora CBS 962.96]